MHRWQVSVLGVGLDGVLRAGWRAVGMAAALLLAACGGGGSAPSDGGAASPRVTATSAVTNIEPGTTGITAGLFVAGSANGDGFVMQLMQDGPRRALWAVRYRAATGQWGEPQRISRNDVAYFTIAITADANGNAMAVWQEDEAGIVAARFDAAAGLWEAPLALGPDRGFAVVAGNVAGVVHVIGAQGDDHVFDPVAGVWRSSGRFLQTNVSVGAATPEALAVDAGGRALGLYRYAWDFELVGSNHFAPAAGQWQALPAGADLVGVVPGSRVTGDYVTNPQVAALGDGDFIGAWNVDLEVAAIARVEVARYSGASGSWSTARTVAQIDPTSEFSSFALRSGGGNTFALWNEIVDGRRSVRVLRLDENGAACDPVRTIDGAVGGVAEWPELVVDPRGNAFAAWHQHDGTRSNIAFSRFDAASGTWRPAELAETEPGDAIAPRPAVAGSQVLLAWAQREGDDTRIKAMLVPMVEPPAAP
jgi:hypothetical protein